MVFFKSNPKTYTIRPGKPPRRDSREDGQTDIVDVPQADGDSYTERAGEVQPADKPATAD